MTPKMELFCHSLLRHGDVSDAAEEAGYSGTRLARAKHGHRILQRDDVKEFLAGMSKAACEETQLTVEKVLTDLEWAKDTAKQGYPTKEGVRIDLSAFIKATELQGKYLKMWVDKVELTGDGHGELMKIIKERAKNGA